ncbi:MAG TPA: hypothetical protein PK036_02885 [Geobacteraceae bacterium]|nr:hypothetical protein [Geobacteraceae bacterium]
MGKMNLFLLSMLDNHYRRSARASAGRSGAAVISCRNHHDE